MALCTPFNECPICHKPIGETAEVIGFPDLVPMFSQFDGNFYDSCAHQACLDSWPRRDEFVAYFNQLVEESLLSKSLQLHVLATGRVVYGRSLKES